MTITVRNVAYTMPVLAYQVSGSTVVFPGLEGDEPNAIRVRFDRWRVARDCDPWRELPLDFPDMGTAVKAAMEFESTPGVSWDSCDEDLGAWLVGYVERHRARAGGDR